MSQKKPFLAYFAGPSHRVCNPYAEGRGRLRSAAWLSEKRWKDILLLFVLISQFTRHAGTVRIQAMNLHPRRHNPVSREKVLFLRLRQIQQHFEGSVYGMSITDDAESGTVLCVLLRLNDHHRYGTFHR